MSESEDGKRQYPAYWRVRLDVSASLHERACAAAGWREIYQIITEDEYRAALKKVKSK